VEGFRTPRRRRNCWWTVLHASMSVGLENPREISGDRVSRICCTQSMQSTSTAGCPTNRQAHTHCSRSRHWQQPPERTTPAPTTRPLGLTTQVSGHQASDGKIYIGADTFDRSRGVSMYRVDDLTQITHREHWQPWNPTDHTWGTAGQPATTTITPFGQNWGEISLREIDGKPVLASTNFNQDPRASPRSRCMAQPAWQTRLDRRSWS